MTRTRGWTLLFCFLSGCSTHPCADFSDYVKPGKLGPTKVTPYGGVAIPQGAIIPAAPDISVGPPAAFPAAPGAVAPVVPPPAALPPASPGFQLQPPLPPPPPNLPARS